MNKTQLFLGGAEPAGNSISSAYNALVAQISGILPQSRAAGITADSVTSSVTQVLQSLVNNNSVLDFIIKAFGIVLGAHIIVYTFLKIFKPEWLEPSKDGKMSAISAFIKKADGWLNYNIPMAILIPWFTGSLIGMTSEVVALIYTILASALLLLVVYYSPTDGKPVDPNQKIGKTLTAMGMKRKYILGGIGVIQLLYALAQMGVLVNQSMSIAPTANMILSYTTFYIIILLIIDYFTAKMAKNKTQ